MKLTKEILDVLKYHGYITFVVDDDDLLKRFPTVEELIDAGFVTEVGVLDFVRNIFNNNGKNQSAGVSEKELEKQAETVPEDVVEEPVVEEPVVEPEPETVNETAPAEETVAEPESETVTEPVAEPEPEVVVEEEKPVEEKPKTKKTTTKKTTKKES